METLIHCTPTPNYKRFMSLFFDFLPPIKWNYTEIRAIAQKK